MSIDDYLRFVADRLKHAQINNEIEEILRLLTLVIETCQDKKTEINNKLSRN